MLDDRWKKSSTHPSLAFSKTLKQYNEEDHVLQTSIIVNYFTEKKVTCIHFMILALSVFPKYIINWVDTSKIYEGKYQATAQAFAIEQMGRNRRDEYSHGVPRQGVRSQNPSKNP